MIGTRDPRGVSQPGCLLAILTILFLQTMAAPGAAQNDQSCPGVDTIQEAFDQGEIPEEFPDPGRDPCRLDRLARPLGDLTGRLIETGDAAKLRRLAQFLVDAGESCGRRRQRSAFIGLATRLSETTTFPVEVGARGAKACASLNPLVDHLLQQAVRADPEAASEPTPSETQKRQVAEPIDTGTVDNDNPDPEPIWVQPLRDLDQRLTSLEGAHGNLRKNLASMERGNGSSSLGPLLLSVLSLGIAMGGLLLFMAQRKRLAQLDPLSRRIEELGSEISSITKDDLVILSRRLDRLERPKETESKPNSTDRLPPHSRDVRAARESHNGPRDNKVGSGLRDESTEGTSPEFQALKATQKDVQLRLDSLKNQVEKLERTRPPRPRDIETTTRSSPALGQLVEIERGVLRRRWVNFENAHPSIIGRVRSWEQAESPSRRLILTELPEALGTDSALQSSLAEALGSLREDEKWLRRLSDIPQLKDGFLNQGGSPSDPKSRKDAERQLSRIRDAQDLLGAIETTDVGKKVERFTLDGWLRAEFLEFADEFFKHYAVPENEPRLRNARAIVVKTLNHAGVEPIEIELGKTPFDSKLHVARSDSCEPDKPDGAIVGIVRSGFRDLKKDRILQRPEVVVNRV